MTITYTLGQLTDDTLRQLRGTTRDRINLLANPMNVLSAGTIDTMTFTSDMSGIVTSSVIVVDDETVYVLGTSPNINQASVLRGYDDTVPTAHSPGTVVVVDPPFTRGIVQDRIKDEIRSWPPQLFAVGSVEIPYIQYQRGYDLGAITVPIVRVLDVTAPQPPYIGAPGEWIVEGTTDYSQENPHFPFEYRPDAQPVEFPSGKAIILTGPMQPTVPCNLHVVYASTFDVDTEWDDSVDMIGGVGLDERMLDIAPLGAAGRLLRMTSVRRAMLNVEGQSREDQDVTMQAILQAAEQFKMDAKNRQGDMQQQLLSDWPYRSSNL